MIIISEEQSAALIDHAFAFERISDALVEAASGARHFPAVIAHGSSPSDRFSIKSASSPTLAGLKIGAFWADNPAKGLPRHNSTILLIDQSCGRIGAVVEAARVNAYRTAAADAVAASVLARPDSQVLALFGAGHQAEYECMALARILPISRVLVVARDPKKAAPLLEMLRERDLSAEFARAETACRAADIIVTATPSRVPLFEADWVRPGTHVAGMGSDAAGKQELPVELLFRSSCYCDLPSQSVAIGEFQHVVSEIAAGALSLTAIGDVLSGRAPGRRSSDEITVFDSSGIALQDLHIGKAIVDRYRALSTGRAGAPPTRRGPGG